MRRLGLDMIVRETAGKLRGTEFLEKLQADIYVPVIDLNIRIILGNFLADI